MKLEEIAAKYGVDIDEFGSYLTRHNLKRTYDFRNNPTGVPDELVKEYVKTFEENIEIEREQAKQEEQERIKQAELERIRQAETANILISSGFSFDGYRITKYSGYISGDDCVTMPRNNFFDTNNVANYLCGSLVKIRRQALQELKEAAYDLGCNAVIGVDFDYIVMDPQHAAALNAEITVYEPYVICVTANGNAVIIEKDT